MAFVTDSKDSEIGSYSAKILTTYQGDDRYGHTIVLFDEDAGYMFTIFGNLLPLEETLKIAEALSYEIVEDAPSISTESYEEQAKGVQEPVSPVVTKENIFEINERMRDPFYTVNQNLESEAWVDYMVTSIELTDTPPQMDASTGHIQDILSNYQNADGSLAPIEKAKAALNPKTQKIEIISEYATPKYVSVQMELHNPNGIKIQQYFFQHFLARLVPDGENYKESDFPSVFNEPVYLSFNDYGGKGAYQLDLEPGETRTVTAVYLVAESELEDTYLRVSGGYGDGTTTCYDHYIKLIKY